LFASFSDSNLLVANGGLLLHPLGFNLDSYKTVFEYPMVTSGYINTMFIVLVGVSINILMTSLGAYFLTKKDIMLQKILMKLIIFTMFFSGGLIPFYLTVNGMGLRNSLWSLIIPFAVNTFNLIIMRTAFAALPDCLAESAEIEGANDFIILFKIMIPMAKATIAVILLYYLVQHWNSWFYATIFISERSMMPIQVILRSILIDNDTQSLGGATMGGDKPQIAETIKHAVVIVATLPILAIYPFLQKYFVQGVMIGAVKG
jgi:putative aldouronate transport system permease protein